MKTFVLATANPDKAAEIEAVLTEAGAPVTLQARDPSLPDVDETGLTLEDNARLKAIDVCSRTGLAAIADDTGLEVDALDGAPGVRSARFAGEHARTPTTFTCCWNECRMCPRIGGARGSPTVAIARWPDGREVAALGTVEGVIATSPRGANGFGYDPVFIPIEGDGRTFAEMDPAEKHACSHRGRAFRTLADGLRAHSESS